MAFLADGSLLLGTMDGVRIVAADGCPLASSVSDLGTASVVALAVSPPQAGQTEPAQTAYAVVGGDQAGLWRSTDGGRKWELRAPLDVPELTNAVVLNAASPEQVYLSVSSSGAASTLFVSVDGGATLTAFPQDLALTLLHAEASASGRLWAIARDALTVGNRGFAILRADSPAGPWRTMLRVNYFGGFVVDPHASIWVGDEIGGVYRSDDGGDTFVNMGAETDVACLAYAGESLWACTPGTTAEAALQALVTAQSSFVEVMALNDVEHLAACPDLDVDHVCAAAWFEWQRDVLMRPLVSQDAGTTPPEGNASDAGHEATDAGVKRGAVLRGGGAECGWRRRQTMAACDAVGGRDLWAANAEEDESAKEPEIMKRDLFLAACTTNTLGFDFTTRTTKAELPRRGV